MQRELRLQRPRGLGKLRHGDVELRLAGGVGVRQILERLLDGGLLFVIVGPAEGVAVKAGASRGGLHSHRAADLERARRRAVEETAVDGDFERLALGDRRRLGGEVELHAIRDVVLDHEGRFPDRRALRIGIGAHPPGAGRCGRRDRDVESASAETLVGDDRAAIFDAVRPLHHHRQRHVERGDAARVAQQRGYVHGLAGAIDAAFGVDEGIERRRRDAPGDAAVAEVECGRLETEEGVIAARIGGDDEGRRQAALPAHQAGLEQRVAGGVGASRRDNLVVAGHQAQVGLACRRARQRIDEDVDAVLPGERGDAEIGDDEPLGRERIVVVALGARGLRRHHVDAGAQGTDRFVDRERRRDLGVERVLDRELPGPHLEAALVGEAIELVAAEAALEVVAHHRLEQVAVADPIDLHRHRSGVDGDDRDAALAGPRQHVGLGGETCRRAAVANVDRIVGGLRQRLLHGRRQAGAQGDGVTLAVFQALDAELLVVAGDRRLVLAGHGDEGRQVHPLARQRLGELEAHARRGGIRIDAVVEHPEAVLVPHLFVLAAHVGDVAQRKRLSQRVERRTPLRAIGVASPDQDERVGLLVAVRGALVGDVGGGRRALEDRGAFALVGRPRLQDGAGEAQPVRCIGRRDRCDLSERVQGGVLVPAQDRCIGVAAECGERFRHRPGIGLDLSLRARGGFDKVVAVIGFVGGKGGKEREQQQRSRQAGAERREHRSASNPAMQGTSSTARHLRGESWRNRGKTWRCADGAQLRKKSASMCAFTAFSRRRHPAERLPIPCP